MNVIAVDIGTNSLRSAIVRFENDQGKILVSESKPITVYSPSVLFYEHDSNEIWSQLAECIKVS